MQKLAATIVVMGLVVTSVATGVARQARAERPDFSGRWSLDAAASSVDATGPNQPSFAAVFMAIQDNRALTLQRKVGTAQAPLTVVYKLDGSESRNLEATMETASTATWQGNRLTIITQLTGADRSLPRNKLERVMWLDANGRLFVETTNGLDAAYVTVYRRATD